MCCWLRACARLHVRFTLGLLGADTLLFAIPTTRGSLGHTRNTRQILHGTQARLLGSQSCLTDYPVLCGGDSVPAQPWKMAAVSAVIGCFASLPSWDFAFTGHRNCAERAALGNSFHVSG